MDRIFDFVRSNIVNIAALASLGMAINAHDGSPTTTAIADLGISPVMQAGAFLFGAALLLFERGENTFVLGTLPMAIYIVVSIMLLAQNGGPLAAIILYALAYCGIIALYGGHNGS